MASVGCALLSCASYVGFESAAVAVLAAAGAVGMFIQRIARINRIANAVERASLEVLNRRFDQVATETPTSVTSRMDARMVIGAEKYGLIYDLLSHEEMLARTFGRSSG